MVKNESHNVCFHKGKIDYNCPKAGGQREYDVTTMLCHVCTGYRITPQALNCIIKRYSRSGKIYFDDFVACCVKLRSLTGECVLII